MPTYWPVGVRHAGGVSPVPGFYDRTREGACRYGVRASVILRPVPVMGLGSRGSASSSRNCEASSTDADALADQLVVVMKPL